MSTKLFLLLLLTISLTSLHVQSAPFDREDHYSGDVFKAKLIQLCNNCYSSKKVTKVMHVEINENRGIRVNYICEFLKMVEFE